MSNSFETTPATSPVIAIPLQPVMVTTTIGDTRPWSFLVSDPSTGTAIPLNNYDSITFSLIDESNNTVLTRSASIDIVSGKFAVLPDSFTVQVILLSSEWGGILPGFYNAVIEIVTNGVTIPATPIKLQVLANLARLVTGTPVPVTIDMLRMFTMDKPQYNKLLDGSELTDEELYMAAQMAVDQYNDTPPPISSWTITNFPYRSFLILGASSYAFRIAANRFRRNRLPVETGGLINDEDSKAPEYEKAASELAEIYGNWVSDNKIALNAVDYFATITSHWARWRYYAWLDAI